MIIKSFDTSSGTSGDYLMLDSDGDDYGIVARLSLEFVEYAGDQLEDIEAKIAQLEDGEGNAEEYLQSIQREIHNIKGQGSTFGFPITGRVAHMLEDYLLNASGIGKNNIGDIRVYLELMVDLIATNESIAQEAPQALLNALPTGHVKTFSNQQLRDINMLLVMPAGLQRKLVVKELLACGFRVIRAYDCIEALSVAVDILPDVVFINHDMVPFSGRELSKVFSAVDKLRDTRIVLLTSYEANDGQFTDLPNTVSVIHKHKDFPEDIGELLIRWGVFGDISAKTGTQG